MESNTHSTLNNRLESIAHPEVEVSNISVHGNQSSREVVIAPQSHSQTSSSWSFNNPSPTSLIDRTLLIRVPVRVSIDAGAGRTVDMTHADRKYGPSAYPVSRCMRTLSVTINNQTLVVEPHSVFPAVSRLFNGEEHRLMNAYSATKPDTYNTIQLSRLAQDSPLKPESQNDAYGEHTRGAFPVEINPGPEAGANITFTLDYGFSEPLPHSFLTRFGDDALTGVSTIAVNITWTPLDAMFLRGDLKNNATVPVESAVTVAFQPNTQAELLVRTFNPSVEIPPSVSLPFHSINTKRFTVGNLQPGRTDNVNTGKIVYNEIPNKLLLFARRRDEVADVNIPDGFLSIEACQLRTEQNIELAGVSHEQLYQMSKKNGYNGTWREWSMRSGSVLVVDISQDIGGYASDTMSRFSFNLTVNFRDTRCTTFTTRANPDNIPATTFDFYVVGLFSSKLTLDGNSAFIQGGMLDSEVLASLNQGFRTKSELGQAYINGAHGAGFGSFFKKHIKKTTSCSITIGKQCRNFAPASKNGSFSSVRSHWIGRKINRLRKLKRLNLDNEDVYTPC